MLVLQQAYTAGIPLYLIGDQLAQPLNYLSDQGYFPWQTLLGLRKNGTIDGPHYLRGIMPASPDCLFIGWYPFGVASTNISYAGNLERLDLTSTNLQVVADVPTQIFPTNSPIMLRYPAFTVPDFGETRRLVQDFRVTGDVDTDSQWDRNIIFLNGVAWLLRMCECPDWNVLLNCLDPSPLVGHVGEPMTFTTRLTQNGGCTAGGVLVTNQLSQRLELVSAAIVPQADAPTNTYQLALGGNAATARFSGLERNNIYDLVTVAIPRRPGWLTNVTTVSRGIVTGVPCTQVAFVEGPAPVLQLKLQQSPDQMFHLQVTGGVGLTLQLESSTDFQSWENQLQVQPNQDPYDIPVGPASGVSRYFRLRILN